METKKFDAVQFMRQVRDKMGADMRDMSFEEQRAYIEQHASKVRRELETNPLKPGGGGALSCEAGEGRGGVFPGNRPR
jgi:hypothetical protein